MKSDNRTGSRLKGMTEITILRIEVGVVEKELTVKG
jgi:hypothetical protein